MNWRYVSAIVPSTYQRNVVVETRHALSHDRMAGAYFITICTAQRQHYFGNIDQNQMQLSSVGLLADVFWHEIYKHAKHVELGSFVVMPNHVHGILILNGNADAKPNADVNVETRHALSLQSQQQFLAQNRFRNQGKNTVSSIIGSYKSAVTKHANRLGLAFAWQSRFHDYIIRNDAEYQRINDYIERNPDRWHEDKFYIELQQTETAN